MKVTVLVRPKDGILDPQGRAVEQSLPHLDVRSVSDVRVGRRVELMDTMGVAKSLLFPSFGLIGIRMAASPAIAAAEVISHFGARPEADLMQLVQL